MQLNRLNISESQRSLFPIMELGTSTMYLDFTLAPSGSRTSTLKVFLQLRDPGGGVQWVAPPLLPLLVIFDKPYMNFLTHLPNILIRIKIKLDC